MRTRQFRRHQRERLFERRKSYFGGRYRYDPGIVAALIDTPTPCSCWMCRNERQNYGPTIQERRAAASFTPEV